MTLEYVRHLVDYTYWARDRVLQAVERLDDEQYTRDLTSSFASIRDTLVHLYAAEWIWYSRWTGVSPTRMPSSAAYPDRETLVVAWRDLERQVRSFAERLDDAGLSRSIEYTRISGEQERASFAQMIGHVVNHGTYHRGQVTTLLRQLGATPPDSTDLITYFREHDAGHEGKFHG